ncbi:hypothetical protein CERSUDRAFT_99084 [Gelatoporia subvermispora B]|uniref:F-box domain-containing protein n=1 Tax=Ceriporiopsis subvermispora (strain B) TaxID=914234 RepID=M2R391_CERS8|nr:hypothetical protein CERSUDRAFT_99084 [Gelatoporia subvermispora B]
MVRDYKGNDFSMEDEQLAKGCKKWISATHICRQWRHMALASPILWSLIRIPGGKLQDVPFAQMCLQRSGSAPLVILVEKEAITRVLEGIIDLVRVHAEHVRCLKLVAKKTHEQLFHIDFPLPMLHTLELRAARAGKPRQHSISNPLHFPSLRVLALENADNPWELDFSIFPLLTSLKIKGRHRGAKSTATQYFGLLSTLRNLVVLELDRFPIPTQLAADRDITISLPALRHLTISHWPSHIRTVVDRLEIPSDANIHVTFYQSEGRPDEAHLVKHTITRLLCRSTATSVQDVALSRAQDPAGVPIKLSCCAISLTNWGGWYMEIQCRTSCLQHNATGFLPLRINFADWDVEDEVPSADIMSSHLSGFCQAVSSCQFKCLHFAGPSMCDEASILVEFLPRFSDICLLEMETIDLSGCISDLHDWHIDGHVLRLQRIILTALRSGSEGDYLPEALKHYVSCVLPESLLVQVKDQTSLLFDLPKELQGVVDDVEVSLLSDEEAMKRTNWCRHFGSDAPWFV